MNLKIYSGNLKYPRGFGLGNCQITSDIFKFTPGSGILCAYSLEENEFLTPINQNIFLVWDLDGNFLE